MQPELLSLTKPKPNDLVVKGKLPAALLEFTKSVDVLLSRRDLLPLEEAPRSSEEAHGDDDDSDDEDEGEDEDEEDELDRSHPQPSTSVAARVEVLDLEPPSSKPVAQPSTKEMTQTIISDAAKAFLFQQRKHNRGMRDLQEEDAGVESTSRAAERIFANTKMLLDRNPNTRVAVLNPLLLTHDRSDADLTRIWQEFHGEEVVWLATAAIENCPKGAIFDAIHLQKLREKATISKKKT